MNDERWEGQAQVMLFGGLPITAHVVRHGVAGGGWFAVATIDAVVAVTTGDRISYTTGEGETPFEGVATNVTTHAGVNSPRATSIRFESA